MKKIAFLVFAVIVLNIFAGIAQRQTQFDSAKNYVNTKLIYLVLDELVRDPEQKKLAEDFNAVKPLLEKNTLQTPVGFEELEQKVKQQSPKLFQKVAVPVHEIAFGGNSPGEAAQRLVGGAFAIVDREYPKLTTVIDLKKTDIRREVEDFFAAAAKQKMDPGAGTKDQSVMSNSVPAAPVTVEKPANEWILWLLVFLVMALAGFCLFLFRSQQKLDKAFHKNSGGTVRPGEAVTRREMNALKNELMDHIQAANNAVHVVQLELRQQGAPAFSIQVGAPSTVPMAMPDTRQGVAQEDVFYMASPSNNYFAQKARSASKENTIYRFTIRANRNEAEYVVINDGAPIAQAVAYSSTYIEPACNPSNTPGRNVTRIITDSPGRVVLDGDKWIIKEKATIHYE